MKVEKKRDDTVFISHNGLTIFFNQRKNNATGKKFYSVNVHVNKGTFENKDWQKVAEMTAEPEDVQRFSRVVE